MSWEGDILKKLRKERELTQAQFAEWLEIPKRTYEKWESGESAPPIWVIKLIQFKCEKSTQGEQLSIEIENKKLFIIEYQTIYAHNESYNCFSSEKDRERAMKCFFDRTELYKYIKLYECKKI